MSLARQRKLLNWQAIDRIPPGFERLRTTCCSVAFEIKNPAIPFMTCTQCGQLMQEYHELPDFPRDPVEITLANWLIRFPLDPAWRGGEPTGMGLAPLPTPHEAARLPDGTAKPKDGQFGSGALTAKGARRKAK